MHSWTRIPTVQMTAQTIWRRAYATSKPKSVANEVKSIANVQKLYLIDPVTPGSIFFLPHGTRLFNRLIQFMKVQQRKYGFQEVVTPLIYKKDLWKTSGHWQHYKKDMFHIVSDHYEHEHDHDQSPHDGTTAVDSEGYSLKPMNCPGHCIIFSRQDYSYRDLPVRFSDFSPLHRNEASGALTGLTRVRKFHQDDGHIFCLPQQIESEISSCLSLMDFVYSVFGLNDYVLTLSTRPEGYIGDLETWNKAESDLKQALQKSGKPWSINEGDGAFYGPKIDILVKDNLGKQHQTATIQLDFQLPKNFQLKYASPKQALETPVLIHRAIFGSLERFTAILIDHFQGKWPFWLSPRQAAVIPIASRHEDYAKKIVDHLTGVSLDSTDVSAAKLFERTFYVDLAAEEEPVGVRIKRAVSLSYNYIIIVGDAEVESGTVSVRQRGSRDVQTMTLDALKKTFCDLEDNYQ